MKKSSSTIIFLFLLILATAICFQILPNPKTETTLLRTSAQKFEEKTHSFIGAYEYIMQMKANPKTGRIDASDVRKAHQAADKLAQKRAKKKADAIDWKFIGPNNVGGRTRAILVDKDDSQKMIIGGVSGGIFTSNDGGLNWEDHPQNTEFLSLSISAITQAPNGDIYVGTGENFDGRSYGQGKLGNTVLPGTGVYKSTDRGNSFQLLESTIPNLIGGNNIYGRDWAAIQDIEVSPLDSNRLYVATNRGIQISQDGGETWSKANGISSNAIAYDIAVAEDGKVHAVASSRYYQSVDGVNFTDNFTGNNIGQFEISSGNKVLAMSPSDNDYLYIVTVTNAGCLRKVWQSKNGGETWLIIGEGDNVFLNPMSNGTGCQGWYDLCVVVDLADRERIFLGGVSLWSWSSQDNWNQLDGGVGAYYVHPDKHTLVFDPNDSNKLYIGSDGGIARSTNAQNFSPTFEAINQNYFVTQFYGMAANIEGNVIGGTQDNGTVFVASDGSSLYENHPYITGGDGGFCAISKIKPLAYFISAINGGIKRSGSSKPPFSSFFNLVTDCEPTDPSGGCNPDGRLDGNPLFITPFVLWEDIVAYSIDPNVQKTKFITGACDGRVWMTEGCLDFTAIPSWREIGRFSANRCVSAITVSKDGETVYAGTTDGRMMRISNIDREETTTKEFIVSPGQYVSSIGVDFNPADVVVGLGNYGQDQNIMKSFNANSVNPTFSSIQYNLPLMPVYAVAKAQFNVNNWLVGTELGVWAYDESTQTWTEENEKMGRVPVHSLQFEMVKVVGCEILYAGTHGRGIYRSTDFTLSGCGEIFPDDTVSIERLNPISQIQLYPNPMRQKSILDFTLIEKADVNLQIFDLQGRIIRHRELGVLEAYTHKIEIERGELVAGNYLVMLYSGNKKVSKKLEVY